MSDAHSLLAACWTTGDTTPLLAFADLLDEQAAHDTAELIRLITADSRTARSDRTRDRRLRHLRDHMWTRVRLTAWPQLAVQGSGGVASFSRQPDPARPDRRHIVVRPDRRTVHLLHVELDRDDEVVRSRDGAELLRRRLPPEALDFVRQRGDVSLGGGFSLAHDHFPFPDGWQADPAAAEAEQLRQFEAAVEPALLPVIDLPAELVPFVAWLLSEYLADRPRRVRGGEPVAGAHLFVFRGGRWHHGASLESRDSGRAAELLRRRLRWDQGRGVVAGLLVRVADGGRIIARKLAWIGSDGHDRETANLGGATAALSAADYRLVTDDLELNEAAFVLDTQEKLRNLFVSGS
jgi:uncharacterized protein (TIGR02996 family)